MAAAPRLFPKRIHLNALTLRMYLDQELSVLEWARWARSEVDAWDSTADPGGWDAQVVLDGIAARAATVAG
jgi:PadR family transcriptional regulator AphA